MASPSTPKITASHTVPGAGKDDGIRRVRPAQNRAAFDPGYEHPVQLYSTLDLPAGTEAALRGRSLANTLEKTIAIREIKFVLTMVPSFVGVEAVSQVSLGGMVAAHLSVGKIPLTNGPVPIWLLGSIFSRFDEDSFAVDSTESTSVYVWKLRRPFHMPPGAQLSARFRHNGLLRQSVTIHTALAGSVVKNPPRVTSAPYASAFVGTPVDVATALDEEVPETALANITGQDLHVDRMIGRVASHNPQNVLNPSLVFSDANHPEVAKLYSLRAVSSGGQPVIRDFSPFRLVFPYSTAAWECPHTMKAGDFYKVAVRKTAGTLQGFDWQRGQPFISIVGSREVPL